MIVWLGGPPNVALPRAAKCLEPVGDLTTRVEPSGRDNIFSLVHLVTFPSI